MIKYRMVQECKGLRIIQQVKFHLVRKGIILVLDNFVNFNSTLDQTRHDVCRLQQGFYIVHIVE